MQFAGEWKSLENFLYFATFTRFDGLCIGALLALAFESERWKQALARFAWPVFIGALLGMIVIVIADPAVAVIATKPYLDMWGYSLISSQKILMSI